MIHDAPPSNSEIGPAVPGSGETTCTVGARGSVDEMETTIGEFLRSRRDRITPGEVGLPRGATGRRVPGLRREEVALLAGVSPDYYIRLEQGRTAHVSDQVLDAVANALSFSDVETEHLRNLARPKHGDVGSRAAARMPAPARDEPLARLLATMTSAPALLLDGYLNIVASNVAAEAVLGISRMAQPPNSARHLFLHPESAALYRNWAEIAAETVAQLRLSTGRRPDDARLTSLVGELAIRSDPFRQMWARGDVREKRIGAVHLMHPVVGAMEFDYQFLTVPAHPDRSMITYLAEVGSPTAEALGVLLSWVAVEPDVPLSASPAE